MISLVLLAVVAYSSAASLDTCAPWSAWSECRPSKHCSKIPAYSFPKEQVDGWDHGRSQMERLKVLKERNWAERDACLAHGTCPERAKKPYHGQFDCTGGMAGEIPCQFVNQLSFLDFDDMGYVPVGSESPVGNDIWGWTDPDNGDEYAIMGMNGGTGFVRVTDPINPVAVGFMSSNGAASTWRDMKVIKNHVYIGSEARSHGLQVFDLTRLRGLSSVQIFQPDAINEQFGSSHNIVHNEDTDYIYVVGSTQAGYPAACSGLMAINVADPLNPVSDGCYSADGYTHDAQCVIYHGPDTAHQGREICFAYNEDTLTIVDVTDKSNMFMISKSAYMNAEYTHQGWLTDDHQVLLLDDELDESNQPADEQFTKTYVWDIADLEDPQLRSIYESSDRCIDHNQYIIGDYTFQANYESGLKILHIDRTTFQLETVAHFDVFPSRTTANFNGAWSVYPYFASGNIILSSIDYGLFTLSPDWAGIESLVKSKTSLAEQTRTRAASGTCPASQQSRLCNLPVFC